MKVSIITPFYHGRDYMKGYQQMLEAVERYTAAHPAADGTRDTVEVIIVNDSPEVPVPLSGINLGKPYWRVITNVKNVGIHASRIVGLNAATGDYVIFLDQDDFLREDAVSTFLAAAAADAAKDGTATSGKVFISNAVFVSHGQGNELYRTEAGKKLVWDFDTFCNIGTQIVSPGQVMLNRLSIPDFWKDHPLKNNGADDYFLWLLLLSAGAEHVYVDAPLYIHRETESNLSADTRVTDRSAFEFLDLLSETDFPPEKIARLRTMLTMKDLFRNGNLFVKLGQAFRHPYLMMKNITYKIRTKTPYGFNR